MKTMMVVTVFTLSYRVREGTPYFLDACRADIPCLTSSMAAMMSLRVYCLYLFHPSLWLGT